MDTQEEKENKEGEAIAGEGRAGEETRGEKGGARRTSGTTNREKNE